MAFDKKNFVRGLALASFSDMNYISEDMAKTMCEISREMMMDEK
ncbi:hypothetical protein Uis1B_0956 [Bifidobacterium margollesii]|uniref:Uncharacterized protein n=1 Tax=Bifidobacterium margollesii TaxID=2020964 RepID=A0A2N5JAH0_9BIFI|nr:hypothetical protein [Bifidobacterium margollesii]PLS31212.1 hypothetical protein Uis1B_0956 [Bifidobacterium margollesii]